MQAPADLCRYAIEHFRTHGGGAIVNVASRSSHRGDDAEHLAYGAAKGGLLALTRGIARGYAHENILAYAVAPSWVATDLSADAVDAEAVAALPLGEPVPPQDVAETIVFLASGRARRRHRRDSRHHRRRRCSLISNGATELSPAGSTALNTACTARSHSVLSAGRSTGDCARRARRSRRRRGPLPLDRGGITIDAKRVAVAELLDGVIPQDAQQFTTVFAKFAMAGRSQ